MSSDDWSLTVLRLNGLKFLRPEKSWRPIVTFLVDCHPEQETMLGCDGQNVNLKTPFLFQNVSVASKLEIKVWKKSESKRKGKKRQLAGSTSITFGELLGKVAVSPRVELKLGCLDGRGKRIPKGQAQKFATIALRLRAPNSKPFASTSTASDVSIEDLNGHSSGYDTIPESHLSHFSEHEISEREPVSQLRQRRKRKIKAYCIDTDESVLSTTDEELSIYGEEDSTFCDDRPSEGTWVEEEEEEITVIRMGPVSWVAGQVLPRFHDQEVTVNVELNVFEDAINRVSPYAELKNAVCDADFQKVLDGVRSEWRWGMNILMALCGLNATVFGFAPDLIFSVDSAAKRAIAISAVTSAIGLVLNFWYQFLYNGATAAKFQVQARDTFGTYFFFCLCCRLPNFFMLVSSIALLAFMFFVSFKVWPQAVLVVSFAAGVLITLQYLLFGAHRIVIGIRWMFRRIGAGFSRLLSRGKEVDPVGKEKDDGSPKPITDVVKDKVVGDEEKENEKQSR
ncbi:hypothetical protein BDM02DRAFT_3271100 [Thelephora ganbajun]|uniref:Uncharacterized protein n=1 Tax=Thelephora ganbajun TaxID=370292 RepID=A0ACB6Z9I5_THEGA|nr:hypothetical protein BDM02DRAFT_3271100 [Thelephora ganbajun]